MALAGLLLQLNCQLPRAQLEAASSSTAAGSIIIAVAVVTIVFSLPQSFEFLLLLLRSIFTGAIGILAVRLRAIIVCVPIGGTWRLCLGVQLLVLALPTPTVSIVTIVTYHAITGFRAGTSAPFSATLAARASCVSVTTIFVAVSLG